MMRRTLSLAAGAAMLISIPLAAEALPVAPAPNNGGDPQVTLVAGGCGVAFHRGPYGGCRPNRRIIVRPRIVCRIVGLIPHRVCRRVY